MRVSVLGASPHDHMVNWEPPLPALAQHHERVACHMSLALKNINSKFEVQFLLSVSHLPTIVKSKNR